MSISRILYLIVLLVSFDITFAETQLQLTENTELEASSYEADLTATFDEDSSIIPPGLKLAKPAFNSTIDSVFDSRSASIQCYWHVAIRAPPHSSFIPT